MRIFSILVRVKFVAYFDIYCILSVRSPLGLRWGPPSHPGQETCLPRGVRLRGRLSGQLWRCPGRTGWWRDIPAQSAQRLCSHQTCGRWMGDCGECAGAGEEQEKRWGTLLIPEQSVVPFANVLDDVLSFYLKFGHIRMNCFTWYNRSSNVKEPKGSKFTYNKKMLLQTDSRQ